MTIEWFRDLVIIIFALGAVVACLVIAFVVLRCYQRASPIIDAVRETARTAQKITKTVEVEVAQPISQVAAFLQGIRMAIDMVRGFTRKKEGN